MFALYSPLFLFLLCGTCVSMSDHEFYHELLSDRAVEKWCEVVKTSKEPDLLMYNRIPKCGSSAISEALRDSTAKKAKVHNLPFEYWGTKAYKNDMIYDRINRDFQNNPSKERHAYVGHILLSPFDRRKVNGKNIEYINVMRTCSKRVVSQFKFALEYNKTVETDPQHFMSKIGTLNVSECYHSYDCIRNSELANSDWGRTWGDQAINFMSGDGGCIGDKQKCEDRLMHNLLPQSKVYLAFGLLEYLSEFYELLACVYPSFFNQRKYTPELVKYV